MKREKRLTKRDRKELKGPGPSGANGNASRGNGGGGGANDHIHCVACGRHIDPSEFGAAATATRVLCEHKSAFASCVACVTKTRELLAEHDRTGQPVKTAGAWH